MRIFSPNHGALPLKPRSTSPQTTGLLLLKPRSASPQAMLDPIRASPRLQEHHCDAVWSTATHSLCREHVWRMASWVCRSDCTYCEPGGPTRSVERRAAEGVHARQVMMGCGEGGARRGGTTGDTPNSRDPSGARDASPSMGGPRVAARPLLASAVQEKDGRGNNCIIAARRLP